LFYNLDSNKNIFQLSKSYKILGLEENCSFDKVKEAYRTLSMKYHPDLNSANKKNAEMFYKITDAYNDIKKDLKQIHRLLKLPEDMVSDEVELEYRRKLEDFQHRVRMGNKGAKEDLHELKRAYTFFRSAYNNSQETW